MYEYERVGNFYFRKMTFEESSMRQCFPYRDEFEYSAKMFLQEVIERDNVDMKNLSKEQKIKLINEVLKIGRGRFDPNDVIKAINEYSK